MSDDETAIRELVDTLMTATKAGDRETILSLLTDDYLLMMPGQLPLGKATFAAALNDAQALSVEGTLDIEELKVLGDWAYMRCHFKVSSKPPGKWPVSHSGRTLDIVHKQADGRWLIAREANLGFLET